MKDIPLLFVPDEETGLATDQVTPGCEWVAQGQGVATRKYDGLCSLFHQGKLWKRRVLSVRRPRLEGADLESFIMVSYMPGIGVIEWEGSPNTEPLVVQGLPENFYASGPPVFDGEEGRLPGWMEVDFDQPENVHFKEAWDKHGSNLVGGRTYELCGPKVNRNPEKFEEHVFVPHGNHTLVNAPRLFPEIREYLEEYGPYEGIVFRMEDGRMARVKRKDFGLPWPV